MATRWMKTPYDEWWAEGVGAVLDVQGVLWYGYPVDGTERIGPFRSRLEAQRALEASGALLEPHRHDVVGGDGHGQLVARAQER